MLPIIRYCRRRATFIRVTQKLESDYLEARPLDPSDLNLKEDNVD